MCTKLKFGNEKTLTVLVLQNPRTIYLENFEVRDCGDIEIAEISPAKTFSLVDIKRGSYTALFV